MVIDKRLQGHGDALFVEFMTSLDKTLTTIHEHESHHDDDDAPELVHKYAPAKALGTRGVGERRFCSGDPLLKASERYHRGLHALPA